MHDPRLHRYLTAAGALATVGSVSAAPVPIEPMVIEGSDGDTSVFSAVIDLNGNGQNDFSLSGYFDQVADYGYIALTGMETDHPTMGFNRVSSDYSFYIYSYIVVQHETDDEISDSNSLHSNFGYLFSRQSVGSYEDFVNQRGYAGLKFSVDDQDLHFACMEMEIDLDNALVYIHGGVYENAPDTPVICRELADILHADRFELDEP